MSANDLSQYNCTISVEEMASAIRRADSYTVKQRIHRFDGVAAKQGNMMGATVQISSPKVPMDLVEESLYVLLVLFKLFESVATNCKR